MEEITLKSYAKINLTLDVIKKRADGYHDLDMVMQTINLHDTLIFQKNDSNKITIKTDNDKLKNEHLQSNLIYKAIIKTFEFCKYKGNIGINVILNKVIPMEAGLAGGSSNGACAIKAINKMYNFNLSIDEMIQIGKSVGADVPFCLVGGTARVTGIGEKIEVLKSHMKANILLAKPKISVSTKYIFENLIINDIKNKPNTKNMIKAIEKNDLNEIAKNLCNVLEGVTAKKYSEIYEIKKSMLQNGSIGSVMTGSGSAVFGYFNSYEKLKICKDNIKKQYKDILLYETTTINSFGE